MEVSVTTLLKDHETLTEASDAFVNAAMHDAALLNWPMPPTARQLEDHIGAWLARLEAVQKALKRQPLKTFVASVETQLVAAFNEKEAVQIWGITKRLSR